MPQPHERPDITPITSSLATGAGEAILELLNHLRSVAEDDGEVEMAAAVEVALKRCAAIHVRRQQGNLLNALTGSADQ